MLLTHLEACGGVPAREGVVQAADHPGDGVCLPAGVVVHVHSHHHHVLEGCGASPQLSAQLAVDLQRHLLHHRGNLLFVGDGFVVYDLAGHGFLHTAKLLHGGISSKY